MTVTCYLLRETQSGAVNDATFEEPWGATLIALETNLATICASVPVFWTPLQAAIQQQWNQILVTKEIEITCDPRYLDGYSSENSDQGILTKELEEQSRSATPDIYLQGFDAAQRKGNNQTHCFV